jgi:GT2 family glycosyltransferase
MPNDLAWLFEAGRRSQETVQVRTYFASLGDRLLDRYKANKLEAEIGPLRQQASLTGDDLARLRTQLEQLHTQVVEKDEMLTRRGNEIEELHSQLDNKDELLTKRSNEIEQLHTQLDNKDELLAKRSNEIEQLGSDRDSALERHRLQIIEKDELLTKQGTILEQLRGQLLQKDQLLTKRDSERAALAAHLAELEQKINSSRFLVKAVMKKAAQFTHDLRGKTGSKRFADDLLVLFDKDWYLSQYPDVARLAIDPLQHYLTFGGFEGRDPSAHFDSDWYLAQNSDVAAKQINPLVHYLRYGASEGRDPNPNFDTGWYLARYPDVAAAGVNPLVHYAQHGTDEGRTSRPTQPPSSNTLPRSDTVQLPSFRSWAARGLHAAVRVLNRKQSHLSKSLRQRHDQFIATLPELAPSAAEPLDVTISVVIPTYNAGPEFYWLLRKLKAQKGIGHLEIVVVDSGSNDETRVLARKAGCRVVEIEKREFSHSGSRNLGAENATGELLLFMVQDAYPIGDYWLNALATCLLKPLNERYRISAVSCAEFPRRDSEIFYDQLIDTHYKFLGCRDADRIGRMVGADNISLRTQGQLSDVACLITRDLFNKYRFQGRYAEDLTLGIRLIRDAHQIGMLSSIKVIHSHRRKVDYYVRRAFVDVIFLKEVFPDWETPAVHSVRAVLFAAGELSQAVHPVPIGGEITSGQAMDTLIRVVRGIQLPSTSSALSQRESDRAWLKDLVMKVDTIANIGGEARRSFDRHELDDMAKMQASFVDRIIHLREFVDDIYPRIDETIGEELNEAIEKHLGMSTGAMLGFFVLHVAKIDDEHARVANELRALMVEGI